MASGVAQIRKSVLTLALPVTVSSLLQRTEGIVAVFLVGGLGATSIAAVGLGQLLAFMATTLVSGLSVGANVLVAQDPGKAGACPSLGPAIDMPVRS